MSDSLRDYIQSRKTEFDEYTPSPKVWENIASELDNLQSEKQKSENRFHINIYWRAAAVFLLVTSLSWFSWFNESSSKVTTEEATASTIESPAKSEIEVQIEELELHYRGIISHMTLELAQSLPKDIHKEMQEELNSLNETYQKLKNDLLDSESREAILEAMKENLELQLQIIQYYLSIIKGNENSQTNA